MKLVRFHPEAEQELVEHEAWYRQRSEVAAQGFLLELDHAIAAVPRRLNGGLPAGETNVGMCSLAFHSRFSIAFVEIMSSLRLWPIKVVVLAIGTIASSRAQLRAGRRHSGFGFLTKGVNVSKWQARASAKPSF